MKIDSMLASMANGSTRQKPVDYAGHVFRRWRFVRRAYSYGGHTFWDIESTLGCGCKKTVDASTRNSLTPCPHMVDP